NLGADGTGRVLPPGRPAGPADPVSPPPGRWLEGAELGGVRPAGRPPGRRPGRGGRGSRRTRAPDVWEPLGVGPLRPCARYRAAALSPEELATIVYTSGTTGAPKGVMLAHRNLVDMARGCLQEFDISEADSSLSFLPYSHVLERINSILVLLAAGGTAWLSRGIEHLPEDIQVARPTVMVAVPRVYEKVHQRVMAQVGKSSPRRPALFRWALGAG